MYHIISLYYLHTLLCLLLSRQDLNSFTKIVALSGQKDTTSTVYIPDKRKIATKTHSDVLRHHGINTNSLVKHRGFYMSLYKQGQTVLITGASSGIGYELSKLFARDGYHLVLTARNETRLQEIAHDYRERYGSQVTVIAKDLAHSDAPQEILQALEQAAITIDVLVNNAGFGLYGEFTEIDTQGELDEIQVNITALTYLTRQLLPGMLARRSGSILNVASVAAFVPGPMMAVYYATKAYVLSFSEALSAELKGTGVTLTVLCPGLTASNFIERSSMNKATLVQQAFIPIMDSATVARLGYQGMKRGKRRVVTGIANQILATLPRFFPRTVVADTMKFFQKRKG